MFSLPVRYLFCLSIFRIHKIHCSVNFSNNNVEQSAKWIFFIKWKYFSDKYIIITNVVLIIFFPLYHLHLFQILIIQSHKLHYLNILIKITTSAFAWSKTRYLYILGQKYKAKKKLIKCILLRLHKFKALMLS